MPGKPRKQSIVFELLQARVLFSGTLPDLTYDDNDLFVGMPQQTIEGEYHSVLINVTNQGANETGPVDVGLYLSPDPTFSSSSVLVAKTTVSNVTATSPQLVAISANFPDVPAGTYYPIFVIDPDNKIAESDKTNNQAVGSPVEVDASTVDLSMTSVTGLSTTDFLNNGVYDVSFAGAMTGTTDQNSVSVGFYLSSDQSFSNDDISIGSANPSISGSTFSGTARLWVSNTATGSYYLLAVADSQNNVPEFNESNNTLVVAKVGVRAGSIIQTTFGSTSFSGVSAASSTLAVAGYPISLIAYLQNVGEGDPIPVTFSLSHDQFAGADDEIVIGSAQTQPPTGVVITGGSTSATFTGTLPSTVPPGDYYLVANGDGLISFVGDKITVHAAKTTPDLSLNSITTSNDSSAGSSANATTIVSNLSSFRSAQTNINLYYSTDNQLDASDVLVAQTTCPPIDPASTQTLYFNYQVPETLASGVYYPIAVLDPSNTLGDTDRSDNTAVATPLQIISGLTANISAVGDTLVLKSKSTVRVAISDQRGSDIQSRYVASFYFSKDQTISSDDQPLFSK